MYEELRREIIITGQELKRYQLVALGGGNVSMRLSSGNILVTPSGIDYDYMNLEDVLLLSPQGEVLEGTMRPSVDTEALLYIFANMPEVNGIIHTHQPYATAIGLIQNEFPVSCTTLANVTLGAVTVAPYSSPASLDMGKAVVQYNDGKRAVILRHHGVVSIGPKLKDALYAAVYMEEAAKSYLAARAVTNQLATMTPEEIEGAVEVHRNYGQKQSTPAL